ncbi:hypothetical protein HG536_0D06030 [Torulaspora globosa]|uniref:3',5'-cyclic-nucleotide phosphodiesterase n=1 Tax=Torulaspora globosa TaxID=48254 RepID=A0A7G3ZHU5_9SACH|nr:uncharacterized protein HG536_0D06030 [Torulaspora globosa]QLL33081.1 hypothetical protein HG536_0D06030 [Torulaspora globosa]
MSNFEVTVLGASGGTDGGATQCFMVRPMGCRGLRSICVDGGAGFSQISQMLARSKDSFKSELLESFYANDFEPAGQFFDPKASVSLGFPQCILGSLEDALEKHKHLNTFTKAMEIYMGVKEYYITHAHLDHIGAMVLNSPFACDANSGDAKLICALPFTLQAIEKHIFNDVIWPDLLHGGSSRLKLSSLTDGIPHVCGAFPQWDIIPFKVHHGFSASIVDERVYSTVYLFSDRSTKQSLLVCGDLEPDSASGGEPLLEKAWEYIATRVPRGNLKGIIVECSSSASTPKHELYGHMSPAYLVGQLSRLREMYGDPDVLAGLSILVTHVKTIISEKDPRLVILQELREAALQERLDVRFSMAVQGYTFSF